MRVYKASWPWIAKCIDLRSEFYSYSNTVIVPFCMNGGLQVTESSTLLPYRKTLAIAEGYGSISKGYNQATGGDNLINSTIIRQPIIVNG